MNAFYSPATLRGLCQGGAVFLQTDPNNFQYHWERVPEESKKILKEKKASLWALDSYRVASGVTDDPALIQRMQGIIILGVFLRISPFVQRIRISEDMLFNRVKKTLEKYFGHKDVSIVQKNLENIQRGYSEVTSLTLP